MRSGFEVDAKEDPSSLGAGSSSPPASLSVRSVRSVRSAESDWEDFPGVEEDPLEGDRLSVLEQVKFFVGVFFIIMESGGGAWTAIQEQEDGRM